MHNLVPPFWASKIRFLPYSVHPRTVCMRVEIYGCYWNGEYQLFTKIFRRSVVDETTGPNELGNGTHEICLSCKLFGLHEPTRGANTEVPGWL